MPKSYSLKTNRVILESYLKTVYSLVQMDDTSIISATEVNICFAKLSCEYTCHKNWEIIEKVKSNFNDLEGKKNYMPTFVTLLEHTLRVVKDDISIL